jgi:hypothetical protein
MSITFDIQKLAAAMVLAFSLATCTISCTTVDCSIYKTDNPKKCKCIRENGDFNRAQICSVKANKKYKERVKNMCYRTCFTAYDCNKCEEL